MSKISEIAADVFAISNLVAADERVSWIPRGLRGFDPQNQYLLRQPEAALLIDTGMTVHADNILSAVQDLLGDRHLIVYTTRSEPDCVGNLPRLVGAFPRLQIVNANVLNPAQLVHLPTGVEAHQIPIQRMKYGQTLDCVGFPHVRVIDPVIRLLGTSWLYDEINECQFSSDFFGVELTSSVDDDVVRSTTHDQPDVRYLRAGILAKFAWLAPADTDVLAQRWDDYFSKTQPHILAPSHGRLVSGKDVVALALERYRQAAFHPV